MKRPIEDRVHIHPALCQATQGGFGGCSRVLHIALLTATFGTAASDLHNVFVNWGCALHLSGKGEHEWVVRTRDDLPTRCLLRVELLTTSLSGR